MYSVRTHLPITFDTAVYFAPNRGQPCIFLGSPLFTTMDLDALDRLINDACSPSPQRTIRRATKRFNHNSSSSSLSCPSLTNSGVVTNTTHALVVAPCGKNHTTCNSCRSFLVLLFKSFLVGMVIKLVKPDFCISQSHAHGQSRFLRGNNVLLNDSPFRPRFLDSIYHSDDIDDKAEEPSI
jgi:hypothetical protein